MGDVVIEQLGGFVGGGTPLGHLRMEGRMAWSALSEEDQRRLDALFAERKPVNANLRYRLTRDGPNGPETVEAPAEAVPSIIGRKSNQLVMSDLTGCGKNAASLSQHPSRRLFGPPLAILLATGLLAGLAAGRNTTTESTGTGGSVRKSPINNTLDKLDPSVLSRRGRLQETVAAYRAALKEHAYEERVPPQWAMIQIDLRACGRHAVNGAEATRSPKPHASDRWRRESSMTDVPSPSSRRSSDHG